MSNNPGGHEEQDEQGDHREDQGAPQTNWQPNKENTDLKYS